MSDDQRKEKVIRLTEERCATGDDGDGSEKMMDAELALRSDRPAQMEHEPSTREESEEEKQEIENFTGRQESTKPDPANVQDSQVSPTVVPTVEATLVNDSTREEVDEEMIRQLLLELEVIGEVESVMAIPVEDDGSTVEEVRLLRDKVSQLQSQLLEQDRMVQQLRDSLEELSSSQGTAASPVLSNDEDVENQKHGRKSKTPRRKRTIIWIVVGCVICLVVVVVVVPLTVAQGDSPSSATVPALDSSPPSMSPTTLTADGESLTPGPSLPPSPQVMPPTPTPVANTEGPHDSPSQSQPRPEPTPQTMPPTFLPVAFIEAEPTSRPRPAPAPLPSSPSAPAPPTSVLFPPVSFTDQEPTFTDQEPTPTPSGLVPPAPSPVPPVPAPVVPPPPFFFLPLVPIQPGSPSPTAPVAAPSPHPAPSRPHPAPTAAPTTHLGIEVEFPTQAPSAPPTIKPIMLKTEEDALSSGAIAAIIICSLVLVVGVAVRALYWKRKPRKTLMAPADERARRIQKAKAELQKTLSARAETVRQLRAALEKQSRQ